MQCPRCDVVLIPTHRTGNRYECPQCRGLGCNSADVGMMLGTKRRRTLMQHAVDRGMIVEMTCPLCRSDMHELEIAVRAGKVTVEVCTNCSGVWLDHGEIVHLSSMETTEPEDHLADPLLYASYGKQPSEASDVGRLLLKGLSKLLDLNWRV